ncbi:sialate O-acetylesterase [Undibacterium sp. MH2W]|uniref:sialate O-acetylesterase n=1 Tax=Undibacterium sp. MH2W TaxID=3413044 RepID=UPI003BF2F54C
MKLSPYRRLLSLTITLLLVAGCFFSQSALASVRLPRLVSDGMVLQRDKPIRIWGWADKGEHIEVTLGNQHASTQSVDGRWQVTFAAMKAGGPYCIDIKGVNHRQICDVLIGDVWIAAGQSNMELKIDDVKTRYPDLIATTHYPGIREFSVPWVYNFQAPASDFQEGEWRAAEGPALGHFSAAAFFFARQLHEKYHVPIGIVMLAVGGSPAEAWMSEEALSAYPHYLERTAPYKDDEVLKKAIAKENAATAQWYASLTHDDVGVANGWQFGQQDANDWKPFIVPGNLHEQGIPLDYGSVWFRKTIDLSEEQIKKHPILSLGSIVDHDQTYINGVEIGSTPNLYVMRRYPIAANVLKVGPNVISIRVVTTTGNAGFIKDKKYALEIGGETLSLEGSWEYKVGAVTTAPPPTTMFPWLPYGLYNAKLAPCLPLGIKGVIWYQGESNTDRASEYAYLFPDLIKQWRHDFNQGDFPFLFVQLANYQEATTTPVESRWAELREAQRKSLRVPNTGMAVTIDIGEWNDIHPLNKQTVGERLALQAQKIAYHDVRLIASGPRPQGLSRSYGQHGHELVIRFESEGGQLVMPPEGKIAQLAIAGADKQYVWAESALINGTLHVWSPLVPLPHSVRYAWSDNPIGANLKNRQGLPASPFELSLP